MTCFSPTTFLKRNHSSNVINYLSTFLTPPPKMWEVICFINSQFWSVYVKCFVDSEEQPFTGHDLNNVHFSSLVMHCLKKFASLKYFGYIVLVFILEALSAESDLFFNVLWRNIGFENMYKLKAVFYWDQ